MLAFHKYLCYIKQNTGQKTFFINSFSIFDSAFRPRFRKLLPIFSKSKKSQKASKTLKWLYFKTAKPKIFIKAYKELDTNDILFTELKEKYASCNLKRRRCVLKITDSKTNEIIGCAIANRAPLGLNFSFLENRTYYIIDRDLDKMDLEIMVKEINWQLQSFYQDFENQSIPIVTDKKTAKTLLD